MCKTQNIYVEKGYTCRINYLECISKDYNIDLDIVFSVAYVLGPDEDFDGLISVLNNKCYGE